VVLSGHDGKILCDNTLDQRLALAFDAKIPDIRRTVFAS
jgi:vacuolar-type H+-ATPase subunit E/Vma4